MPVYTVHEPPPRESDDAADPDRFVFVRDGFYVLGVPARAALDALAPAVAGAAALRRRDDRCFKLGCGRSACRRAVKFAVGVLIGLLIGFEGPIAAALDLSPARLDQVIGVVVARRRGERRAAFLRCLDRRARRPVVR